MQPIFDVVGSLQSAGLWTILIGICVKFITGIVVAANEKEFHWDEFGNVLKNDLLKYVAVLVLVYMYQQPEIATPVLAVLGLDVATGVARNVGKIFPGVADKLPNSILNTADQKGVPVSRTVEK